MEDKIAGDLVCGEWEPSTAADMGRGPGGKGGAPAISTNAQSRRLSRPRLPGVNDFLAAAGETEEPEAPAPQMNGRPGVKSRI